MKNTRNVLSTVVMVISLPFIMVGNVVQLLGLCFNWVGNCVAYGAATINGNDKENRSVFRYRVRNFFWSQNPNA